MPKTRNKRQKKSKMKTKSDDAPILHRWLYPTFTEDHKPLRGTGQKAPR